MRTIVDWTLLAVCLAACVACPRVFAAEPKIANVPTASFEDDGREIFLPAYFDRFAPQTALDMVENLPGFLIRQRDASRGLGQGGTNILIDGRRVSGKSNDPVDVLDRTPYGQVVRVEIVDGSSLGISGLAGPVANVVLSRAGMSGTLEWRPRIQRGSEARLTDGAVSVSGSRGPIAYTVGFENDAIRDGSDGPETVRDAEGRALETRTDERQFNSDLPQLSIALSGTDTAEREANLNLSYAVRDVEFSERSERRPADPTMPGGLQITDDREDEWNGELSFDLAFDGLGGRTKLIAFQSLERSDFRVASSLEVGDSRSEDLFLNTIDEGETILRLEQTYRLSDERTLELATEGVLNVTDFEASLFALDADGDQVEIELPGANSRVEERRAELSATYGLPIGERVDVQASAAVEVSEIEQQGDIDAERSFVRPKGFVSLAYAFRPSIDLRMRVDRRVGQLEFGAFASSVDLADDNETFGNGELVPQQSWFVQGAVEKRFPDSSSMTLTVELEDLEDVVQRIPITDPEGRVIGDGFGNVDSAQGWKIEFIGTQRLERLGLEGAQIEWDFTYRGSEIEDPFSGETRRLNGQLINFFRLDYRHDLPDTDYAYGVSVFDFTDAEVFRRDQISLGGRSRPRVSVFVEDKDFWGLNARLSVENLAEYTQDFRRDVFSGPRPDADLAFRESRRLNVGPIVALELARTF
ncbi:MAG: hypothetical protein AAGN46_08685 [Acidobacteriota bacterium]